MPNISHRELTNYLNNLRKKYNSNSMTAQLSELIARAEALGSAIHGNQSLTTQNERQDLYGDIREYLDAFDNAFEGDPNKAVTGEKLNALNAIGDRLSNKATAIGGKPANAEILAGPAIGFARSVNNNYWAMHDSILNRDIARYTNNSYIALKNAQNLYNEKKLDDDTFGLINQLNANLVAVTNNPAITLETRHKASRSISHILYFYNENLFDPDSRSKVKPEQIAELATNISSFITENGTAISELRRTNPDSAASLETILNNTSEALQKDLNAISTDPTANRTAYFDHRAQVSQREEAERLNRSAQDRGFTTQDQLNFQRVIDSNPQYKEVSYLDSMMAVLGIREEDIPETVIHTKRDRSTETVNMHDELRTLKQLAIDAMTTAAERYDRKQKNVHLLSGSELEDMSKRLNKFETRASRFERIIKSYKAPVPDNATDEEKKRIEDDAKKIENARKTVSTAHEELGKTTWVLAQMQNYAEEYGGENYDKNAKLFSIYDVQGKMNPDVCGELTKYADELESHGSKIAKEAEKDNRSTALTEAANAYKSVKDHVKQLTEDMKNVFKITDDSKEYKVKTLGKQQIKALSKSFQNVYLETNLYVKNYQEKVKDKNAKFAPGEKEFFEAMVAVNARAAGRYFLLSYLTGDDDSLSRDIENYNKTPPEQRPKANNAAYFEYAMKCMEHYKNGTLLAQFLFEGSKAPNVENVLSLVKAKKDIDDANNLEKRASGIEWESGKRKLDSLAEYDLFKKQTGINENIYQFATYMDHETFMDVFNKSIKKLPPDLKEVELVKYENGEPKNVKVDVEDFMRKEIEKHILYKKVSGNTVPANPGSNVNFYNTRDCNNGFFTVFRDNDFDTDSMNKGLQSFIRQLNRNLYNAGIYHNKNSVDKMELSNPPMGYNEGHARTFAYELSRSTGNEGMLPYAKMEKKAMLPLGGGRAAADQFSNVQIGQMEPDYDKTSKATTKKNVQRPSFYTTTKNFRSSDFVGEIYGDNKNYEIDNKELMGLSSEEIVKRQREFNEKRKKRIQEGTYTAHVTSSVRDYTSFDRPEIIKEAADLQVMDYLMGINSRRPDDLRIRFQIDPSKKDTLGRYHPQVVGIGGAFGNTMPFSRVTDPATDNSKDITKPEDMLIISQSMLNTVRRWKDNQFSDREKEAFNKLTQESKDAFRKRIDNLVMVVDRSLEHEFKDICDEKEVTVNGKTKVVPDPTKILLGGFRVEQGFIRVVSDEEFKKLHMDDLVIARNEIRTKDKCSFKPANIFDSLASMPDMCHEALNDKSNALMTGAKSPERGKDIDDRLLPDNDPADIAFNKMEIERLLTRSRTLLANTFDMDRDRDLEFAFHKHIKGDSTEYFMILETAADIDNWAEKLPKLLEEEKKFMANVGSYTEKHPDAAKIIREERAERLKFEKQIAREKGLHEPTTLPPPGKDDPYAYFSIMQRNEKLRKRIEKYLEIRKQPKSNFGKMRKRRIVALYNKLNKQMEDYAYYTGITTYPPRKCILNDDYTVKYENVYKDRYTFETEGVCALRQREFNREFKFANRKNRGEAEIINTNLQMQKHNNKRFKTLFTKKSNNTATKNELEELKTLTFDPAKEGLTGFTEKEIGTSMTKYPDPNTVQGRAAVPTFGEIFTELKSMKKGAAPIRVKDNRVVPENNLEQPKPAPKNQPKAGPKK